MKPRAAHFILHRVQADSPLTDTMVGAFRSVGYDVDVFAPGVAAAGEPNPSDVPLRSVEYGKRWLLKNAWSPRWKRYAAFSAAAEDPAAIAGTLSFLHRRPFVMLADEIKSGSYWGNAPRRWKSYCRWAMRRARLTIVNDRSRVALQREYAALPPAHPFAVYPGSYRANPTPGDRAALRAERRIPDDALVLGYSGVLNSDQGIDWILAALARIPYLHVLLQASEMDPLVRLLMTQTRYGERLHVESRRLSYREAWAATPAIDIGMAIYRQSGPQFQNMGTSSTRLCMFLSNGVPVIASRQPSLAFLEDGGCGILVADEDEFVDAIRRLEFGRADLRARALACWDATIDPPGHFAALVDALERAL